MQRQSQPIAREGNKFAVADFSAIEARVLSWLQMAQNEYVGIKYNIMDSGCNFYEGQ